MPIATNQLVRMNRRKTATEETPLIVKTDSVATLNRIELDEYDTQVTKTRGISMTWKNLKIRAVVKKRNILRSTRVSKEIIHNVTGYVPPSCLVAILGASGSGKSTLMSVLANRQTGDIQMDGDVRVNGRKIRLEEMKKISGFVYQDDIFTHPLTVSEHLQLAGKLKLGKHLSSVQRDKLVNEVIIDVGLTKCANQLIGSSNYGSRKKNLSGGELKRLSVATELLTNPALLFCDEPTTGLDSYTAFNVMKLMSDLTRQKSKTIICSIHQPSAQIFDLFDQIILLQNGTVAFNGTTADAMAFFQSIGYPYNESQNPANYLVNSLAINPRQEYQAAEKASEICSQFQRSQYGKAIDLRIEQENSEQKFTIPKNVEHISWLHMLYLLTHRDILSIVRDPAVQIIKIINKLFLAVMIGVIMMGSATRTQEGISSFKGILFIMVSQNSLFAATKILNHFPSRMHGFLREYSNDTNTPLIFYLSNVISLMPAFFLQATLFASLLYTLAGLRNDWFAFLASVAIINVVMFAGSAFGILISLSADSISVAQTILQGFTSAFNSLTGVWVNFRTLHWIIRWIPYVSWMSYAVEALFILQMEGVDYIECSESPDLPCLKNGQEVLEYFGFDASHFRMDVILICCIYVVLQVLGFFMLRIKLYPVTKR